VWDSWATLIVVPDGPLWSVPFQALETTSGKFLIEEKTVLLAPSAAALLEMTKRREAVEHGAQQRLTLLAMGNPFGLGQTVTMGIISAEGRNNPSSS